MSEPELRGVDEEFLSSLSHELRNPISVLSGYADILELRGEDEQVRLEATARIREAADRLSETLDRLLDQARNG